jgi:uncharacterized protein (DUF2252 family)
LNFLRGSAGLMCFDLVRTPATGIPGQICGDCHLANFGEFGTAERNVIFDVNDFDETAPGPWEWDIKRLAASFAVAGRSRHFPDRVCREAATAVASSYRERMHEFSSLSPMECWYSRIDASELGKIIGVPPEQNLESVEGVLERQRKLQARYLYKKTDEVGGARRIREDPPLVVRPRDFSAFADGIRKFFAQYRGTLALDRKALFDRYELVDVAQKVVGIGSVGTRCAIALFLADDHEPLFLQVKEARASVVGTQFSKTPFEYQGRRVVEGQRLMQAAGDPFLGWARIEGTEMDFYIRQLRDLKNSLDVDSIERTQLLSYARLCGWALARAHSKASSPSMIAGYIGKGSVFDAAIARFSMACADRVEADFQVLARAAATGRIAAETDL